MCAPLGLSDRWLFSGICPGPYLIFDIVINDLHEDTMYLITSEDDAKLGAQLIHVKADLPFKETQTSQRNGPAEKS